MNWRAKGLIQKALTYVPRGERLHYLLQRTIGGLHDFHAEFSAKVDDWCIMARHLRESGQAIAGARMMEIGTGWYPTLPFCCYLAGAARVLTVDLNPHLKADLTRRCAEGLATYVLPIARACEAPESEVSTRHGRLLEALQGTDLAAATAGVVEYRAGGDARRTGLPDASFDVIFSNSVLEHVPADAIRDMFAEAWRLLPTGKIMFHSVNCGDHYAYTDSQISQLNYLRFSDAAWEKWNNRFLYQIGFAPANLSIWRKRPASPLRSRPQHLQSAGSAS